MQDFYGTKTEFKINQLKVPQEDHMDKYVSQLKGINRIK